MEKVDACILFSSPDTIKKYVPGVNVASSGSMTKADIQKAIATLFPHYFPSNALDKWVKEGCILSYLIMQRPIPKNLIEGIARQDAANSGVSRERLQKAGTHPMESRITDVQHPAYLVMITTPI